MFAHALFSLSTRWTLRKSFKNPHWGLAVSSWLVFLTRHLIWCRFSSDSATLQRATREVNLVQLLLEEFLASLFIRWGRRCCLILAVNTRSKLSFDKLDLKKTKHVLLNYDSKQEVHHWHSGLVLGLIKHRFKMIKGIVWHCFGILAWCYNPSFPFNSNFLLFWGPLASVGTEWSMSALSPPTVQEYQHLKKSQHIIPQQQDLKKRVSSSFFF